MQKPFAQPKVTWGLIGLNVAIFVAMVFMGVSASQPSSTDLMRFGANRGIEVLLRHQWWRLLTAGFLHIGLIHLLVNMYSLYRVGPFVEALMQPGPYAVVYVMSIVVSSGASVVRSPMVVSAGASGAIFCVFGAILGYTLAARGRIPEDLLRPLRNSMLLTLVLNVALAFSVPNLNHVAHGTGFAYGVAAGVLVTRSQFSLSPTAPTGTRGKGLRWLWASAFLAAIMLSVSIIWALRNPQLEVIRALAIG